MPPTPLHCSPPPPLLCVEWLLLHLLAPDSPIQVAFQVIGLCLSFRKPSSSVVKSWSMPRRHFPEEHFFSSAVACSELSSACRTRMNVQVLTPSKTHRSWFLYVFFLSVFFFSSHFTLNTNNASSSCFLPYFWQFRYWHWKNKRVQDALTPHSSLMQLERRSVCSQCKRRRKKHLCQAWSCYSREKNSVTWFAGCF